MTCSMIKTRILFYLNFQVAKTPENILDGNECVLEVAHKIYHWYNKQWQEKMPTPQIGLYNS